MAQLVLAAGGAALGNAMGWGIASLGMSGSAVGWAVGSLVGSMLGQKGTHTVQPGIGDKSIQASTYGSFKTIIYGTVRVAGNVIDGVSEVREVRTTTRVGKGGPKSTNTTLSWNADVAIDIGQAGCLGIRKLWNSGKLVYDVSSGGTADSIIASSIKATSFKLYNGSETQLPDPTLEAIHGVGNVPAYRGRSYIVLAGVDCPNGQIPQLSWEVCYSITPSGILPVFTPAPPFEPAYLFNAAAVYSAITRVCGSDKIYHIAYNYQAGTGGGYAISAEGFKLGSGYKQKLWVKTWSSLGSGTRTVIGMNGSANRPKAVRSAQVLNAVYDNYTIINVIDMLTGVETTIRAYIPGVVANDFIPGCAAFDSATGKYILLGNPTAGRTYERFNPQIYNEANVAIARIALPATSGAVLAFYNDIVYAFDQRSSQTYLQMYDGATGAFISEVGGGPASLDCNTFATGQDPDSMVTYNGFLSAISAHGGGVFVYCKTNNTVWKVESSWIELSGTITNTNNASEGIENAFIEQDYIVEGPVVAAPDNESHYRVAPVKSFDPLDITVESVITAICEEAGIDAADIEASTLTQTFRGYALTRLVTARAALEPILKAYFLDVREQDGIIEFLDRSTQTSSFTVPYEELAAGTEDQGEDPFPLKRIDVVTLPRSVSVSYMDYSADYQTGTQKAIRQTIDNINELVEDLPLATTASHAATVAEVLLYDAWSAANKRSAVLSRKYAAISPGDFGTFEYPEGIQTLKRVVSLSDDGLVIRLDLEDGDAQLYDLIAVGASTQTAQSPPGLTAPTRMEILDIPPLRDQDNNNGLYVALSQLTTNWYGAILYKGSDDSNLEDVASVTTSTQIGIATTALANWLNNTVDRVNTVTVENVGTQASISYETALDTKDNLWLIGDELLVAMTSTYVADGVYVLSDLIRGLKGTDRFKANHVVSERAVRLPTTGHGIARPILELSEIGVIRYYRPISFGLALDSESSTAFASNGYALKPLSPVDFKRSSLNGNTTLTWNRRSRLSGEFPSGSDIALGESAELYYVDIYTDSDFTVVVRTISCDSPTAIYTLAQQSVDFGGYQITLHLRIYQVSALIGRGVPLQVISTLANLNATPPSLLAHMDGAGIIVTPVDSSAYAFPAVLTGTAALSNVQSKFSGSSLYVAIVGDTCRFDTSSAAHSFGTGDFTVEYWIYPASAIGTQHCFSLSPEPMVGVGNVALYMQLDSTNRRFVLQSYGDGVNIDGSVTTASAIFTIGNWIHVAVARKAGVMRLFVNGILRGSYTSTRSLNYVASQKVIVGGWQGLSHANVYYDEVRITKGEALYFDTFTPPTSPF